jgi:hypothetical protein
MKTKTVYFQISPTLHVKADLREDEVQHFINYYYKSNYYLLKNSVDFISCLVAYGKKPVLTASDNNEKISAFTNYQNVLIVYENSKLLHSSKSKFVYKPKTQDKFVQFKYMGGSNPGKLRTIMVDSEDLTYIVGFDVAKTMTTQDKVPQKYLKSKILGAVKEVKL